MNIELVIADAKNVYYLPILDDISWKTERKESPGQLTFSILENDMYRVQEGDAVSLRVDEKKVFYGFVFTKKLDKDGIVKITAYDQLRYLKNKHTMVYGNLTASELVKKIAKDFLLKVGKLEDSKFKIKTRVEQNKTLFDIIQTSLDMTLENKNKMYVLYDDFGKLALKDIGSMKIDFVVDENNAENYDYTSSIDKNTFNKVRLLFPNKKTGKYEVSEVKDSNSINNWGVLQYSEILQEGENGAAKAEALLSLYNKKTRSLSFKNVLGDLRVRAGSMIVVRLDVDGLKLSNYMLVEKCTHKFKDETHFMDLTVRGGDFIA